MINMHVNMWYTYLLPHSTVALSFSVIILIWKVFNFLCWISQHLLFNLSYIISISLTGFEHATQFLFLYSYLKVHLCVITIKFGNFSIIKPKSCEYLLPFYSKYFWWYLVWWIIFFFAKVFFHFVRIKVKGEDYLVVDIS